MPFVLGALAGCGGGGNNTDDSVVLNGAFPVVFAERSAAATGEPLEGPVFAPGGDLFLLELSSPSARRRNITGAHTQGAGDAADPEVSFDGRRIVFSMRGPNDPTWDIWEFDVASGTLRRVIADDALANAGDDVEPHYLPDGRIVFSSNRQTRSKELLVAEGIEPFAYSAGHGREEALVLHVMDADGANIEQISFNQGHDRNPTLLMNGQLLYSRWDQMGKRNQQPLYVANPDGTGVDVLYGAFSPGEAFVDPRQLPDGRLIATVMPLSGTAEGGALVVIDQARFSDQRQARGTEAVPGQGQANASLFELPLERRISPFGRFAAPYPVWDGTGRVLVAWTPYQRATAQDPLTGAAEAAEGEARYGIYMLDLASRTQRPVALAEPGRVLTDPVAVMPRPLPAALASSPNRGLERPTRPPVDPVDPGDGGTDPGTGGQPGDGDPDNGGQPGDGGGDPGTGGEPGDGGGNPGGGDPGTDPGPGPGDGGTTPPPATDIAVINIKSVYDTGFLDIMGDSVLADGERIPRGADGRPNLEALRDPARTRAEDRPARYLRVTRALPMPPGLNLDSVGATAFGMQQILGYAPVQPDGSVRVEVPADIPLSLAVVDAYGRAFQTHTNWLQLRPGESRTCNGCHARHDAPPLNRDKEPGPFRNAWARLSALADETMAETLTRLEPLRLGLTQHPTYEDVWTDPALAGRQPDTSSTLGYGGLDPLARPVNGVINYPDHIQPIWERERLSGSCVGCHRPGRAGGGLDLTGTVNAAGRLSSYDILVTGAPLPGADGQPQVQRVNREVLLPRQAPLVDVGGSADSSRSSHLIEKLFEQELLAPRALRGGADGLWVDHSQMLTRSELRLLAEWVDLGAQYYNSAWPAEAALDGQRRLSELRRHGNGADPAAFTSQVHPLLMNQCANCHQGYARSGGIPEVALRNGGEASNRFVLTGNPATDLRMTAALINACSAADSSLLQRAIGREDSPLAHPRIDRAGTPADRSDDVPVLDAAGPDYLTLFNWIASAHAACP